MTTGYLLTNLLAALLLPPGGLLLLGLAGLILAWRRQRAGLALVTIALAGIWLLATPYVGNRLLATLMPPPAGFDGREAEAIVILGGGRVHAAAEYGGDSVKHLGLERLRYGAWLARRLHKPVLVSGGDPEGRGVSEARLMGRVLEQEFGIHPAWLEEGSDTTFDNARLSVPLLQKAGVKRIYLVSHAWHMARAVPEFQRLGMVVVPAGTGYHQSGTDVFSFVPGASGLLSSYFACHEWLGILWYRLQHLLR